MKVFVAGATGVLGRALVPQLVARGHDVVGMTRSASKQSLVRRTRWWWRAALAQKRGQSRSGPSCARSFRCWLMIRRNSSLKRPR